MSINFSVTSKPATPIKNYYNNSTKNQPCNFGAETTKATEEKKSSNTIMYVGAALAFLALVAGLIGLCRKGKTRDVEKPLNEGKAVAQKVEQNVGADDAAKGVNNAKANAKANAEAKAQEAEAKANAEAPAQEAEAKAQGTKEKVADNNPSSGFALDSEE